MKPDQYNVESPLLLNQENNDVPHDEVTLKRLKQSLSEAAQAGRMHTVLQLSEQIRNFGRDTTENDLKKKLWDAAGKGNYALVKQIIESANSPISDVNEYFTRPHDKARVTLLHQVVLNDRPLSEIQLTVPKDQTIDFASLIRYLADHGADPTLVIQGPQGGRRVGDSAIDLVMSYYTLSSLHKHSVGIRASLIFSAENSYPVFKDLWPELMADAESQMNKPSICPGCTIS